MPRNPFAIAAAFLFLCSPLFIAAQTVTCNPLFQKYYSGNASSNEEGLDVAYCAGGGMIVAGQTTFNSAGLYDAFLLKLADNGQVQWTRTLGGALNDKLVKVRQTSDGGFIAIGQTQSFGNTRGGAWIVRTDALGNILWNNRYGNNPVNTDKPKDIIQLADGSFVVAINFNDSTPQSNAALLKLDATGNILWSRQFDHGNDDGFNTVSEWNDTLLVAGYATVANRTGIVMKLNKTDGSFISAQKFTNQLGSNYEALGVEKIDSGIAFGVYRYPTRWDYNNEYLLFTCFRQKMDGSIYYQLETAVSTASGHHPSGLTCRMADDGGFMYLVSDTTPANNSEFTKVGPYGSLEWGRSFGLNDYKGRTNGMDVTAKQGYVFAGYRNEYFTTNSKNKVQVFKTDRVGKLGTCNINGGGDYTDTVIYTVVPFTWNTISNITVQPVANTMQTGTTNFTESVICQSTVCDTVQVLQDSCSVSLLAEYKSELINEANDITRTTDGDYVMAGMYSYYYNYEPSLTKLKPNGAVRWSKTYNDYFRNGYFWKVLPTSDGNMIVLGVEDYSINHHAIDSTIILKVSSTGDVLWSRKYARSYDTHPPDVKATNDGGFVACITEQYGSGSKVNYIIRFDANGNFVWKKRFYHRSGFLRKILYDGNAVYTALNTYITSGTLEPIEITKLDAQTGDMLWNKRYYGATAEYLAAEGLHKVNDTIVLTANFHTGSSYATYRDATAFIKLKEDGTLLSSFRLVSPNINFPSEVSTFSGDLRNIYVGSFNTSFVVAQQSSNAGDTSLIITLLNSSGSVKWSKKFPNLKKSYVTSVKMDGSSIYLTGKRYAPLVDNRYQYISFFMKMDTSGIITNTSASASCQNVPYTTDVQSLPLNSGPGIVDSVVNIIEGPSYGYFGYHNYAPYVRNIPGVISKVFCSTPGNCSTISITGPDSVCNIRDTVLFRLVRNPGCTAHVAWETVYTGAIFFDATDTTVRILFQHSGLINFKANILSGCTILIAQKNVYVYSTATAVNLGPDTVLCANTTYTLHAGNGYKRYQWNQPSATDSVYTATQPGIYSVTVEDFCGNRSTDSVTITAASFPFSAGPDTSKCNGDSILLNATAGFINYQWLPAYNIQAAGSSAHVFPMVDTSYNVSAEKWPGCVVKDTVRVVVKTSPAINLGNDTSFCQGRSITLQAPAGFSNYSWNTGATVRSITTGAAGIYSVLATASNGCSSKDSLGVLSVFPLPIVNLGNDTSICKNTRLLLQAGNYASYLWQDNSMGASLSVQLPGTYWVRVVDNNGCKMADTIRLISINELPVDFLPDTLSFCEGATFEVQATRSFKNYNWSNGSNQPVLKSTQPGRYWLQATAENGCIGKDTIEVSYRECYRLIYFPSAFTPNNDNLNDVFRPGVYGVLKNYHLVIYSRWGQKVFETEDATKGWNGKVNGTIQSASAYMWMSSYLFQGTSQEQHTQNGTVLLIP